MNNRLINKDSLYIVMPAYNEQDNIQRVLREWYPIIDEMTSNSKLVIADSGSTDSTHQILVDYKKEHPKLEIISNTERWHGSKVVYLYKYAIKNNIEFVFQTDSDGQTVASDFIDFGKDRNNFDAILGKRVNRGDGAFRSFVEWACCKCIYFYFHIKVSDSNVPFRLMKCSCLENFINEIPENHNLPNILVTVYLGLNKCSMCFKEIKFLERDGGKSMYDLKKIINFGGNIIKDFKNIKRNIKHNED